MPILIVIAIVLALAAGAAYAETKDPLNYPLKQYGFMLLTALLGGLVSWYAKVRKGEVRAWNIMQLVGELATSAFAGLICFWVCEASGLAISWTVPLVGIAGHMGTRAISAFEAFAQRKWGISDDKAAS
jgi:hypothetical protein